MIIEYRLLAYMALRRHAFTSHYFRESQERVIMIFSFES